MIVLDSLKTLEVVLAGPKSAFDCSWAVCYGHSSRGILEDYAGNDGVTNGVVAVTMVPAPNPRERRYVRSIYLVNEDNAVVTVTFRVARSATSRAVFKVAALPVGGCIMLGRDGQWRASAANGSIL